MLEGSAASRAQARTGKSIPTRTEQLGLTVMRDSSNAFRGSFSRNNICA